MISLYRVRLARDWHSAFGRMHVDRRDQILKTPRAPFAAGIHLVDLLRVRQRRIDRLTEPQLRASGAMKRMLPWR